MSTHDFKNWLPISIKTAGAEPVVEWFHVGSLRFKEPFFDHTVHAAIRTPFNLLFRHQTSLEEMMQWAEANPGIEPSGFIFHMSRCGSTLVSQMLGKVARHLVFSEPPPFDSLLRLDRRGASEEQRIRWLRAWMSAAGQSRHGEDKLFVKLDAWHTLDLPLIRRAFPNTPWVFIFRNPIEVMVSTLKSPSSYLIPGALADFLPDLDIATSVAMSREDYAARLLSTVCASALKHLPASDGIAIDYTDLTSAVTTTIARHFGLQLSDDDIAAMNAATAFHAKTPQFFFEADAEAKQREASPEIRAACAHELDALYDKLRAVSTKS